MPQNTLLELLQNPVDAELAAEYLPSEPVQAMKCGMMRSLGASQGALVQAHCFEGPIHTPGSPPPGAATPVTPALPTWAPSPAAGGVPPTSFPFGVQGGYGLRRSPLEDALRRLRGGM